MLNNYYSELLDLSDGKLHTEDGFQFNIHKIVLALKNDYFSRLFCGPMGKGKTNFLIPGIRGEILGNVLSFMYSSTVDVNEGNVHDIIIAGDYLLCDDLISHVKEVYMKNCLSLRNCLPLFIAARKINQDEILKASYRFIQTNFEDLVSVDDLDIGELPFEAMVQFMGDKNLRVKNEDAVWMAIAKWVQADSAHRQHFVPDFLLYLTASDVDEKLAKKILEHDIVACNPFCIEINTLKQSSWLQLYYYIAWTLGYLNIKILQQYIQNIPKPALASSRRRLPDHFHFVVKYQSKRPKVGFYFTIYATYDENIDLWREIIEIPFRPLFMMAIGDNIFMFHAQKPFIRRFNLPSRTWRSITPFNDHFELDQYVVLQVRGLIYVLGGVSYNVVTHDNVLKGDMEVYDPVRNAWKQVSPMTPVWPFHAVALGDKIYVVAESMLTQAYDSESNTWTVLSSPSGQYIDFQTFKYRGRLCIIKSSTSNEYRSTIQLYDSVNDKWTMHEDLPHGFRLPMAVVLNNELIVYESLRCDISLQPNSSLMWNEELQCWKTFQESSPMNALAEYAFFTQETGGCTNGILRENKDPSTHFLKSSLN